MSPLRTRPERSASDSAAFGPADGGGAARFPGTVALAVAAGLLTGLAELPLILVKRHVLGEFAFVTRHVVWMAPLAYALLFLTLAPLFLLLRRLDRRLAHPAVASVAFASLGVFSILLVLHVELHWAARALLALGVGGLLGRRVARDPIRLRQRARRVAVAGGTAIVVCAGAVSAWELVAERRSIVSLPEARANAPHIFLLILDTARAVSMSVYGHPRETTPNLDFWVAQRGVRFDWAIATTPWSLGSHASILTGRYQCETQADWDSPIDGALPTLTEVLRTHGYRTAGFVANNRYATRETGVGRGFDRYSETHVTGIADILRHTAAGRRVLPPLLKRIETRRMPWYKPARKLNREVLAWLSRKPQPDRPVFVLVNYMEPHSPYLPPERFNARFGAPPLPTFMQRAATALRGDGGGRRDPERIETWRRRYHGEIAYLDHRLGELFTELDRNGYLDNSLVIVTSDHGEDFDEQGDLFHTGHLYLQTVTRVPLLLAWPDRLPAGAEVATPVSIRSIPATVMELLGIENATDFPGLPLTRYWQPRPGSTRGELVLSELTLPRGEDTTYVMAITMDTLRYIRSTAGDEELYNLRADPWERSNLVQARPAPEELATLRAMADDITRRCRSAGELPRVLTGDALRGATPRTGSSPSAVPR
jgi:arylsulfatase A-like enzyme